MTTLNSEIGDKKMDLKDLLNKASTSLNGKPMAGLLFKKLVSIMERAEK